MKNCVLLNIVFRRLLCTNKDCTLKLTLWFLHELAKECEDQIFTLVGLDEKLSDLITPIADATVEISKIKHNYISFVPVSPWLCEWSPCIKVERDEWVTFTICWSWRNTSFGRENPRTPSKVLREEVLQTRC